MPLKHTEVRRIDRADGTSEECEADDAIGVIAAWGAMSPDAVIGLICEDVRNHGAAKFETDFATYEFKVRDDRKEGH